MVSTVHYLTKCGMMDWLVSLLQVIPGNGANTLYIPLPMVCPHMAGCNIFKHVPLTCSLGHPSTRLPDLLHTAIILK